jgi:hypothetical protein
MMLLLIRVSDGGQDGHGRVRGLTRSRQIENIGTPGSEHELWKVKCKATSGTCYQGE